MALKSWPVMLLLWLQMQQILMAQWLKWNSWWIHLWWQQLTLHPGNPFGLVGRWASMP